MLYEKDFVENFIKPFEVKWGGCDNNITKEEFEIILKKMELQKEQCKDTET